MDSGALQVELDRRFGVSVSDRATMRTGAVPDTLRRRLSKGWGCLRVIVAVLGAVAGAIFAWNIRTVLAPHVPLTIWAAGGAALGAVIGAVVFTRRFKSMAVDRKVLSHTGLMRLETATEASTSDSAQLVAADGGPRVSALVLRGLDLPAGRYRVFYLDLSTPGAEAFQAVGMEVA